VPFMFGKRHLRHVLLSYIQDYRGSRRSDLGSSDAPPAASAGNQHGVRPDGPAVVKARLPLLQTLAAKGTVNAGAHMAFPGCGRVRKVEDGYSVPVSYLGTHSRTGQNERPRLGQSDLRLSKIRVPITCAELRKKRT